MCGIVGAIAQRDVSPILLEGLKRLEYRGYDSAGMAVVNGDKRLKRVRVLGKVNVLAESLQSTPLSGGTGIAHTRWATHGRPSESNAHPHVCREEVALVHNGIVENYETLKKDLEKHGYRSETDTDTEVVVNQIHYFLSSGKDLLQAVMATTRVLDGAYALGVLHKGTPDRLVAARHGSPLVIGLGIGEYFIASDIFALLPVTRRFLILQEGDVADVSRDGVSVYDRDGNRVERPVTISELTVESSDKAGYRHFMQKEIFYQPQAVAETLEGRIHGGRVLDEAFGVEAGKVLDGIRAVHLVACGTSYHAGLVARYWLEAIAGIPCSVEIASEYRYRDPVVTPGTLFVSISQSGETADTLAALQLARELGYAETLAICNVPESSLTRESGLVLLTHAGPEIGVASTKAFTTQLTALMMLVILLARRHGDTGREKELVSALEHLPGAINHVLEMDDAIAVLAEQFVNKHHALFLGRGSMLPVAMEGALKLKEISYIHAEAYAAGELKHGPLALIDDDMPVIAVAPNNSLVMKLESNLNEVRARGGELYVFADPGVAINESANTRKFDVTPVSEYIAPVVYTVPLQLLAYHVAVLKGSDVDQPRNLAKSVTVE